MKLMVRKFRGCVKVCHAFLIFLVGMLGGTFHMVTAFNQLRQYVGCSISDSTTCEDALSKLSTWKQVVKTDKKQS